MKFYYVYVLQSLKEKFIYTGYSENLEQRFNSHNSQQVISTKHRAPYKLIHYEAYRNAKDAKRREHYFKTTKGKTTLRAMLKEYFEEWG